MAERPSKRQRRDTSPRDRRESRPYTDQKPRPSQDERKDRRHRDRAPRSRSPRPEADRYRHRSPPTRAEGRSRSLRSPSPTDRGRRDRKEDSKGRRKQDDAVKQEERNTKMNMDESDLGVLSDPESAAMQRLLGFSGFSSTKNTKVKGNNVYGIRREKKTEYRQYMNRNGGFNRPLSPSR